MRPLCLPSCCLLSPCYYGQPELTYRPILRILTGERPEETRKLVAHKQIEHCPKLRGSEGTNLEFMRPSESLKGRVTYQKSANA